MVINLPFCDCSDSRTIGYSGPGERGSLIKVGEKRREWELPTVTVSRVSENSNFHRALLR